MRATPLPALLLLLGACGDAGDVRLALRPGDSLLDHLDQGRLRDVPDSTAPSGWDARLATGSTVAVVIEPDAWTPGEPIPAAAREPWDLAADALTWKPVGGRLSVLPDEITAVSIDGTVLAATPPGSPNVPADMRFWRDQDTDSIVSWSEAGLRLVTSGRPGRLRARTERDAHAVLDRAAVPAGLRPTRLVTSAEFDDVLRPALRLPAPASIRFELEALACDTLCVSLGVQDRGVDLSGDVLHLSPGAGDGVTFRIDVEWDGQKQTVLTQRLQPGEGWFEAKLDLSPWLGRNLRLVLASDAGPDDDAAFDEALWADLTLLGPVARRPARPSLLIIDIDTLRADRLSTYGYERETSPGLDAWVERWGPRTVVFEDCVAPSSWTLPSTMSLLTGLAVHQHGVDHSSRALAADVPTLAERLAEHGYETLAITESGFVDPAFGFARGFDRYETQRPQQADWSGALAQLTDRRSERPFFMLLHTYMVHAPHAADDTFADPDQPYEGWLAGRPVSPRSLVNRAESGGRALDAADRDHIDRLYDAGVRSLDAFLATFLETLDRTWPASSLLVVITSDHGEELFDHGRVGHGHSLFGELLHVPLIVRFPAPLPGHPRRTDRPVTLLDVAPTLLGAAGIELPTDLPGEPLPQRLGPRGNAPRLRVSQLATRLWSIQQAGHKLILPGPALPNVQPHLYDLAIDPGEHRDRARVDDARLGALRDLLDQYRRRHPAAASVGTSETNADTRAVLQQLGYVDDG